MLNVTHTCRSHLLELGCGAAVGADGPHLRSSGAGDVRATREKQASTRRRPSWRQYLRQYCKWSLLNNGPYNIYIALTKLCLWLWSPAIWHASVHLGGPRLSVQRLRGCSWSSLPLRPSRQLPLPLTCLQYASKHTNNDQSLAFSFSFKFYFRWLVGIGRVALIQYLQYLCYHHKLLSIYPINSSTFSFLDPHKKNVFRREVLYPFTQKSVPRTRTPWKRTVHI
jgi:hypothetical protein